jgi:hypothetical protein
MPPRSHGETPSAASAQQTGGRDFIPKETTATGRIVGMRQIIVGAPRQRFIRAPLAKDQVEEFVKTQSPPKLQRWPVRVVARSLGCYLSWHSLVVAIILRREFR